MFETLNWNRWLINYEMVRDGSFRLVTQQQHFPASNESFGTAAEPYADSSLDCEALCSDGKIVTKHGSYAEWYVKG